MQRDITDRFVAWKERPQRKPILLYGARQVGKSYALSEFGTTHFEHVAAFDLERQAAARSAFEGDLDADVILERLSQVIGWRIVPEDTLIILDEIQASNRALASLKYLAEALPHGYVAAAGSLLGVAVSRDGFSAPVGSVEPMTMRPLSFPEFLRATGNELMVAGIRDAFESGAPYALHERALELLRSYMLVGGMPEAVSTYLDEGIDAARNVQGFIHDLYIADMAKYAAPLETARIREAWASIPSQLAKENHKFQYKTVRSGGRASRYESALDWLETAGLVNRCVQITSGHVPLALHENRAAFKIYQADTGLLAYSMGLSPQLVFDEQARRHADLGAVTENYVAQELVLAGYTPRYWVSQGTAEVDFVIESQAGEAVPVEVKSSENVRSRILGVYCGKYEPSRALRLSPKNFGYDGVVHSVPLYAAFCLQGL